MSHGTVRWFNSEKGYGMIRMEGGLPEDLFVEYSAIEMDGFKTLAEGQTVEFEIVQARSGPQAGTVRVVTRLP